MRSFLLPLTKSPTRRRPASCPSSPETIPDDHHNVVDDNNDTRMNCCGTPSTKTVRVRSITPSTTVHQSSPSPLHLFQSPPRMTVSSQSSSLSALPSPLLNHPPPSRGSTEEHHSSSSFGRRGTKILFQLSILAMMSFIGTLEPWWRYNRSNALSSISGSSTTMSYYYNRGNDAVDDNSKSSDDPLTSILWMSAKASSPLPLDLENRMANDEDTLHKSPVLKPQQHQQEEKDIQTTNAGEGTGTTTSAANTEEVDEDEKEDDFVYDILIIGAGWSGLGAARKLLDSYLTDNHTSVHGPFRYQILEATSQWGGRSRTLYPFDDNETMAIDMGSAWTYPGTQLHKVTIGPFSEEEKTPQYNRPAMPIQTGEINYGHLSSHLGLYQHGWFETGDTNVDETSSAGKDKKEFRKGSLEEDVKKEYFDHEFEEGLQAYAHKQSLRIMKQKRQDASMADIMKEYYATRIGGLNYAPNWYFYGYPDVSAAMLRAQVTVDFATSASDSSAEAVGRTLSRAIFDDATHYTSVSGGGYRKILYSYMNHENKRRAVSLQDNTLFNSVVTKIAYPPDKTGSYGPTQEGNVTNVKVQAVTVTYEDRSDPHKVRMRTKRARTVLLTVPLGVLKAGDIEFEPPLDETKQDAIDSIGFGVLNKCILYWENTTSSNATSSTFSNTTIPAENRFKW